jgi:hypothetical protein
MVTETLVALKAEFVFEVDGNCFRLWSCCNFLLKLVTILDVFERGRWDVLWCREWICVSRGIEGDGWMDGWEVGRRYNYRN